MATKITSAELKQARADVRSRLKAIQDAINGFDANRFVARRSCLVAITDQTIESLSAAESKLQKLRSKLESRGGKLRAGAVRDRPMRARGSCFA